MNNIKKAIRQINAGLSKLNVPTHVLSFVSIDETVPQQTLLVNMGFMYGQAGESVVIVDTDFENKRLANAFKLSPKMGLSDYLEQGSIKSSQIINELTGKQMSIVTPGKSAVANTDYLLDDPKFNMLVVELRAEYDHVLINTPALNDIESYNSLTQNTDGCILVTIKGVTKKKALYRAYQDLRKHGVKVLGYINVEKG
ncbi:hypothetical protein ACN677_13815 [Lactiplantibacillus paraplantarum]|uniref:hypothetical protein n=1 Tax=Lactiplantibacillus paraplantarum TaxID=60520 RepID=UPI0005145109|nr:hypothetical protein [Lactiplantibacillus paraplantarum]ALO02925.1 hypothetical protein ASU28_00410 [Lactiplantibacillus paraplantarum]KGE75002.1 hypothetical protein HR47_10210 [Lactiplantibacillus paraplantarum]